jgi:hypothetical protein
LKHAFVGFIAIRRINDLTIGSVGSGGTQSLVATLAEFSPELSLKGKESLERRHVVALSYSLSLRERKIVEKISFKLAV